MVKIMDFFPDGITPEWDFAIDNGKTKLFMKDGKAYGIINVYVDKMGRAIINSGTLYNQKFTIEMIKQYKIFIDMYDIVLAVSAKPERFVVIAKKLGGRQLSANLFLFRK